MLSYNEEGDRLCRALDRKSPPRLTQFIPKLLSFNGMVIPKTPIEFLLFINRRLQHVKLKLLIEARYAEI